MTYPVGLAVEESPIVMDMVIFRTIFFELFSFLHVHAPYPPFRLLTNLGKHQDKTKHWYSYSQLIMVQQKLKLLLLIVRGPHRGLRLLLHHIFGNRRESRNNHRGYHPGIVLYDLLSHRQLLALRWARSPLDLHPLQVPPANLEEINRAIGSSSHIAKLPKEDGGLGHAPADMMQE